MDTRSPRRPTVDEQKRAETEGAEHDEGSVLEIIGAPGRLPDELGEIGEPPLFKAFRRVRGWPRGQLTAHFHLREFYCKDGTRPKPGRWRTYRTLCKQYLEPMRREFGPATVHSGYRTPSWNAQVGGERGSYHVNDWHDVDDVAADVSFARGTAAEWHTAAIKYRRRRRRGKGGVGKYRTFVHVDTRDYPANWSG
jgi:hypothetical protein